MRSSSSTFLLALASILLLATVGADIAGSGILSWVPESLRVLNIPSILMVLSGVMLATAISHPPDVLRHGLPYLFRILSHSRVNEKTMSVDVERILQWQQSLKQNRHKTRAELADRLDQTFEGYVFGLLSTNYSGDEIRLLGEAKLEHRQRQTSRCADMFGDMGRFAPAFGMLGTLIGLIQMLGSFESIADLGQGLSFALMTTLYGIVMANTIFGPLESKIRNVAAAVAARDRMMLDGILLIHDGVQPLQVYDTLMTNHSGLGVEALPASLSEG